MSYLNFTFTWWIVGAWLAHFLWCVYLGYLLGKDMEHWTDEAQAGFHALSGITAVFCTVSMGWSIGGWFIFFFFGAVITVFTGWVTDFILKRRKQKLTSLQVENCLKE